MGGNRPILLGRQGIDFPQNCIGHAPVDRIACHSRGDRWPPQHVLPLRPRKYFQIGLIRGCQPRHRTAFGKRRQARNCPGMIAAQQPPGQIILMPSGMIRTIRPPGFNRARNTARYQSYRALRHAPALRLGPGFHRPIDQDRIRRPPGDRSPHPAPKNLPPVDRTSRPALPRARSNAAPCSAIGSCNRRPRCSASEAGRHAMATSLVGWRMNQEAGNRIGPYVDFAAPGGISTISRSTHPSAVFSSAVISARWCRGGAPPRDARTAEANPGKPVAGAFRAPAHKASSWVDLQAKLRRVGKRK